MTGDADLVSALARDYTQASLEPADRAMLDYVIQLTRDPHSVTGQDVDGLRGHGFDDRAIHDMCQVASYYNYVNRMAEGLGVEMEEYWTDEDLTLTRAEFGEKVARRK